MGSLQAIGHINVISDPVGATEVAISLLCDSRDFRRSCRDIQKALASIKKLGYGRAMTNINASINNNRLPTLRVGD